MPDNVLYVPFPRELYEDLIRHSKVDPVDLAVDQLLALLERRLIDGHLDEFLDDDHAHQFAVKHLPEAAEELRKHQETRSARAKAVAQDLVWKEVTVQAGSDVRMSYGDKYHFATVKGGKIVDDDGAFTPSEWASKVAANTSRNAWRDLSFREPMSRTWIPAEYLRAEARRDLANRKPTLKDL